MKERVTWALVASIVISCLPNGIANGQRAEIEALPNLSTIVPSSAYQIHSSAQVTPTLFLPNVLTQVESQTGGTVEETGSSGIYHLEGVAGDMINPITSAIKLRVSEATLNTDKSLITIILNGNTLSSDQFTVKADSIEFAPALLSGENNLIVFAEDTEGNQLNYQGVFWAGDNELVVTVVDESDQPQEGITVTLALVDNQEIAMVATTSDSGEVSFHNVPNTTILVEATDGTNRYASLGTVGNAESIVLQLNAFAEPSSVDNNDFSLGTDGWDTENAPVDLITHTEAISVVQVADTDLDLLIGTQGQGPRSVSRTFVVQPNTQSVSVRYRFVTNEVPTYFGSKYNDYYSVVIRSKAGGGIARGSNSMNGLGLGAFHGGRATDWFELSLPVAQAGDVLQFDLAVANVGDDRVQSYLVVDSVKEKSLEIKAEKPKACINETIKFSQVGQSSSVLNWSGGGDPISATGADFSTKFDSKGNKTVTATDNGGGSATADVQIVENSGVQWTAQFPDKKSLGDAVSPFKENITNFIGALNAAGVNPIISAVRRPAERAYLMYYSFMIGQGKIAPANVPAMAGVDICWLHRNSDGTPNTQESIASASAMAAAYQIVKQPALHSRHTEGLAVDMTFSWSGDLVIAGASGPITITTAPRNANNAQLKQVAGGTYHVYHGVPNDLPHWSSDGH